jgi:hypothetical protein
MAAMKPGQEPPRSTSRFSSPEERKRAQETTILEMVYDRSEFQTVTPRERPDFALVPHGRHALPFGVEVTQLFPDQSHARLNLVDGYAARLFSGGDHLHRDDVEALQRVTVQVSDSDGNVKYEELPAILSERPGLAVFRQALADTIRVKSSRNYETAEFTHTNLIILDWFHLPFDGEDYTSGHFFDDGVREALRECPFREVYLVVNSTHSSGEAHTTTKVRIVRLQQLLAMERVFATGHVIDEEMRGRLRDVAHLNRLTLDHVSRVQGYGSAIEQEGTLHLKYRGSFVAITESGTLLSDHQDLPLPPHDEIHISETLDPAVESTVLERAFAGDFHWGYSEPARNVRGDEVRGRDPRN